MKKRLYLLSCLFVLFMGCTDSDDMEYAEFEFPEINWADYDSHTEKIEACQIPNSLLPKLRTSNLVELCIDYPMLMDVYAFVSEAGFKYGVENVFSEFNGFTELCKRKDRSTVFFHHLKAYEEKALFYDLNNPDLEAVMQELHYAVGDMLLGHDGILSGASDAEKKEIAQYAFRIFELKLNDRERFGSITAGAPAYLCARALSMQPSSPESWDTPLDRLLNIAECSFEDLYIIKDLLQAELQKK